MKRSLVCVVLTVVTLAPLAGPFTLTVPAIDSQSSPEHTIRPVSDLNAESIKGALARKWKCAIGTFAIGAALLSTAPATGGVTAILAPAFFNAAAFCLI